MHRLIVILFMFVFLISCSGGIDSDAQKAAELTQQSMNLTKEKELEKANEKYAEAIEIINKYKQKEEEEVFFKSYMMYLKNEEK